MRRVFTLVAATAALAVGGALVVMHSSPAAAAPQGEFPTPANTGVPPGTVFANTVNGTVTVTVPGQRIDRWHITGSLVVRAPNVVITNSQIDDSVLGEGGAFTIANSTVGPVTCRPGSTSMPMGVGSSHYVADRVLVRGHEDGFRASGPGVVIRNSYYRACVTGASHGDGVQDYPSSSGIVVDHNTFDMSNLPGGYTAPVFVHSNGTKGATITNNLLLGGVYTVYLNPVSGTWTVAGNRVVNRTWAYGPYEAEGLCRNVQNWSDNDVVTIDANYRVTSTVRDNVTC